MATNMVLSLFALLLGYAVFSSPTKKDAAKLVGVMVLGLMLGTLIYATIFEQ